MGYVIIEGLAFSDQNSYLKNHRVQDYHDMLSSTFQEMHHIRPSGGIRLTLDFVENLIYRVTAIPVIQFIIGDFKGNDMLCGRMSGYTLQMKGLCRDCDISPNDGDDLCIGTPLKCKVHTKETIVGKTEEELDQFSFFSMNNCFTQMSFGDCERSIYGGTPAEILHAVLLGLCDYIAEGIKLTFTESSISEISTTTAGTCKDSLRQSEVIFLIYDISGRD